MNPIIIAAGVYLSSRIISYISNELTEAEKKRRDELLEQLRDMQEDSSDNQEEGNVINDSEVDEHRKIVITYLRNQVEIRVKDFGELIEQIKESRRQVVAALHSERVMHTPLRKNSLELLLRQLNESLEKGFGYLEYLQVYSNNLSKCKDPKQLKSFSWVLPNGFPYVGKVIWINTDEISNRRTKFLTTEGIEIGVYIDDVAEYDDLKSQQLIPVMITNGKLGSYYGSIEKGSFNIYELTNTHLGTEVIVKEIQKNYIILVYKNSLELFLPKDNLINPNRFPPLRSKLIVYPIKWEFTLKGWTKKDGTKGFPVTVSERRSDAASSFNFSGFPICFEENDLDDFYRYYEENHLQSVDDEFLIGPADGTDTKLHDGAMLKLQFGNIPLFYIEVKEMSDRSDMMRFYFKYHHLCLPSEKTFSADDIFVPFEVGFTPYYEGTSQEIIEQYAEIADYDDITALIWDIYEEFRIQDRIRSDRNGLNYFMKWENITNQLIDYLEQGAVFQLRIDWLPDPKRNSIFADITNSSELNRFINEFSMRMDHEKSYSWKPQFFVLDTAGDRYTAIILDNGNRINIVGKNVADAFFDEPATIDLYALNIPYAEKQQQIALRQFRTGQIVNPVLQSICLNSSNAVTDIDTSYTITEFYNSDLSKNETQRTAVIKAFKEKNFFLIQGPPGTGKTTVIREVIEQELKKNPDLRILIVSQANVAVDNALSGLIEKYGPDIIRCGNGNKISSKFKQMLLQNKCQQYLDGLEEKADLYDKEFFDSWLEIVSPNNIWGYSPALCELIIRKHKLVGATCVGLAKRNIGLERTEFDVVIIDEAGKALPAELLIPLVRAKKAIVIGDQKQLPPIINPFLYDEEKIELEERTITENELFSHSYFERLYVNAPNECKVMLDTQYRMPAVIGTAISKLFYEGRLKNGAGTTDKLPIMFSSNLSFINYEKVRSYHERKTDDKNIINPREARDVVSLVLQIRKRNKNCDIAVITPYKGQKHLIINTFLKRGVQYRLNNIAVDTIDSYQGSEADVVIFCTTRAIVPTNFFKDTKRLNVALSRAKRELIIMGNISYFHRYNRKESCLPKLAEYLLEYANIIAADRCKALKKTNNPSTQNVFSIPISELHVPSSYYMEDSEVSVIHNKIEEFYQNGDFLNPFLVKKDDYGYTLVEGFEQYKAAMELSVTDCWCKQI